MVRAVRDAYGHHLVAVWEVQGDRLTPRAVAARRARRDGRSPASPSPRRFGLLGRTLASPPAGTGAAAGPAAILLGDDPADADARRSCRMDGPSWRWRSPAAAGRGASCWSSARRAARSIRATSRSPASSLTGSARWSAARSRAEEVGHLLHRAEALRRVASDIGSRLDLDRILAGLVDHAMVLFEGDRGAVFLEQGDGHVAGRGQSRPVAGLPARASARSRRGRWRPPRSPRAGRSSRSATATTRAARTSGRPSSRKGSTRCARPRSWTARETARAAQRLPRPAAPVDRPTNSTRSARWRPRRASPSGPPRTTSGWRPGRPSSSRSSSSAPG